MHSAEVVSDDLNALQDDVTVMKKNARDLDARIEQLSGRRDVVEANLEALDFSATAATASSLLDRIRHLVEGVRLHISEFETGELGGTTKATPGCEMRREVSGQCIQYLEPKFYTQRVFEGQSCTYLLPAATETRNEQKNEPITELSLPVESQHLQELQNVRASFKVVAFAKEYFLLHIPGFLDQLSADVPHLDISTCTLEEMISNKHDCASSANVCLYVVPHTTCRLDVQDPALRETMNRLVKTYGKKFVIVGMRQNQHECLWINPPASLLSGIEQHGVFQPKVYSLNYMEPHEPLKPVCQYQIARLCKDLLALQKSLP
ncbi:hypothetical protein Pelo_8095 [Pelomyxa schiedti]|nr:hypothetical protein Pelo_8095 [Pelomyxa schiedti]